MNPSEKQLKKELLKIQIEKAKKELEQLNEINKIYHFNKISVKKSTIIRTGKYLVFLVLIIPVFYVYFSEFIVPIAKYENYKLQNDLTKSYDTLKISKLKIERQKSKLSSLYRSGISFKEKANIQKDRISSIFVTSSLLYEYVKDLKENDFNLIRSDLKEYFSNNSNHFEPKSFFSFLDKKYSGNNRLLAIIDKSRRINNGYGSAIKEAISQPDNKSHAELMGNAFLYLMLKLDNCTEYKHEVANLSTNLLMIHVDHQNYFNHLLKQYSDTLNIALKEIE